MIYSTQRLRWRRRAAAEAARREVSALKHNYRPAGALNYGEARPWELLRAERTQPQIF